MQSQSNTCTFTLCAMCTCKRKRKKKRLQQKLLHAMRQESDSYIYLDLHTTPLCIPYYCSVLSLCVRVWHRACCAMKNTSAISDSIQLEAIRPWSVNDRSVQHEKCIAAGYSLPACRFCREWTMAVRRNSCTICVLRRSFSLMTSMKASNNFGDPPESHIKCFFLSARAFNVAQKIKRPPFHSMQQI